MTKNPAARAEVGPCTEADLLPCFQAMSNSFGHDQPFVDVYFPAHETPAGEASGVKRLTKWMREDEHAHFLKAYIPADDNSSKPEKIIGLAIWTYMKDPPPAELEKLEDVEEVWPNEDDREYMKQLWKWYVVPRTRAIEAADGKGIYVLEMLAVHREYHHRGAGRGLVNWGLNKAAEAGVGAVVESTNQGRPTYTKCGFSTEIDRYAFDDPEGKYPQREKPFLAFLTKK